MMRVFDADEEAGDEWLDSVEMFATGIVQQSIPISIPIMVDGEQLLATILFSPTGRVGVTATSPDPDVRIRLAIGLAAIARARIETELGAEGIAPL